MRIANVTRGTELAADARVADGFVTRFVGLLGKKSLAEGEGLLITPCNSVHTAFMRFPIDVVYIDREQRVAKIVPNLRPFRVSASLRRAHATIELPVGAIAASRTEPGDQLRIE